MSGPLVDSFSSATPAPGPLPVEIAFLQRYGVSAVRLADAASLARRQGVTADQALLAEGVVPETFFYRALAAELGVSFLKDPEDIASEAIQTIPDGYARLRHPIDGAIWLFAPKGPAILRLMCASRPDESNPSLYVMTTPTLLTAAVRRATSAQAAQQAAFSAERVDGELSARASLRDRRPLVCATFLVMALVVGVFAPVTEIARGCALFLGLAFLGSIVLRLLACAASFSPSPRAESPDEAALPVYTIVIALYRESRVVRQLARAIDRLDYPVLCS